MINGYSIRKSAKIVEINIATSFFWRHKILDCISTFLGKGHVDGVVEADEVFFAESFKGTKPSKMPRRSRKRGKHKEGIYYIQHINALHSNLKKWMERFNGVATKYINNYIKWFKWLRLFDTEKEMIKAKNFIIQCNVTHSYIKIKDLKNRVPIYV